MAALPHGAMVGLQFAGSTVLLGLQPGGGGSVVVDYYSRCGIM